MIHPELDDGLRQGLTVLLPGGRLKRRRTTVAPAYALLHAIGQTVGGGLGCLIELGGVAIRAGGKGSVLGNSMAMARRGEPSSTPNPPPRVTRPGGRPERYGAFAGRDDVPVRYGADPRFEALAADPAHGGSVTPRGRMEAMAGWQAEQEGIAAAPVRRGPADIEFYDANGTPVDAKVPPSPRPGARWPFQPGDAGDSIPKQLRKPFPNGDTGQLEDVQVILDCTYLTASDHAAVWDYLRRHAAPGELGRILELNVEL